jgi:hypothetical protein
VRLVGTGCVAAFNAVQDNLAGAACPTLPNCSAFQTKIAALGAAAAQSVAGLYLSEAAWRGLRGPRPRGERDRLSRSDVRAERRSVIGSRRSYWVQRSTRMSDPSNRIRHSPCPRFVREVENVPERPARAAG